MERKHDTSARAEDGRRSRTPAVLLMASFGLLASQPACAQRANENAVTQAQDAFGVSIGNERIGLYGEAEVRGFSPITAGNARIDGLYFDRVGALTGRLVRGSTVRVGLSAQSYPFSAPTGVVDYALRAPGDAPLLSVLAAVGPYDGGQVDIDGQMPLVAEKVSLGVGLSVKREVLRPGDSSQFLSRAAILRIRPTSQLVVQPFWARLNVSKDHASPAIFPIEANLPDRFGRRYYGQDWAQAKSFSQIYGFTMDVRPDSHWLVRAGLFRAEAAETIDFTDLFLNTRADGGADRVMLVEPPQTIESLSGELRATREWRTDRFRHVVHGSFRYRNAEGDYGGAAVAPLGRAVVGRIDHLPEPSVAFGARAHAEIRRDTAGAQYEGYWRGVGEFGLGVQKTRYVKSVRFPSGAETRTEDSPFLVNATAALRMMDAVAVYGSYVTGLEESGTAPENSANFPEVLPALRTSQRDIGFRWNVTPGFRVLAGAFEIHKPYFNLDGQRRYIQLGKVINRGLEFSAAGEVVPGLTMLAGAVLNAPSIDAPNAAVPLGDRPVGLADRQFRFNLDYRVPSTGLSFDLGVSRTGRRFADAANTIQASGYTVVDLGMRYRFKVARSNMTVRAVVQNVGDTFAWRTFASGAIQPIEPRRASISLTSDFR